MTGDPARLLAGAFAEAAARHPGRTSRTRRGVAGRGADLHVAGDELARVLLRALAPAPAVSGDGLSLELWDERATGVPCPALPAVAEIGERHGPAGERFAPSADGASVRFSGPDFDIRLDRASGRAVGWIRDAAALSSWHRARPLQTLFMPWLSDRGMIAVHAAMAAREGDGVLLAGPSGRGKSTAVAAAAGGGLDVLGDDAIALELGDDATVAGHALHTAVKLRGAGLARHPELAGHTEVCRAPWEGETVAFLGEAYPGQVVPSARVRALAFPRLARGAESGFFPIAPARALAALTGCVLSVEPGAVAASFALATEAVERVPAFVFEVGRDTAAIPAGLERLLDGVTGAPRLPGAV